MTLIAFQKHIANNGIVNCIINFYRENRNYYRSIEIINRNKR